MKKNIFKFMAMLAFALPVAFMTSCNDDEEDDPHKEKTVRYVDGEEYLKDVAFQRDDNGNITRLSFGVFIDKSTPTVAYIGVDNLDEALAHFYATMVPCDAPEVRTGNNITISLTDTLNVEKNQLYFNEVNDGATLAKVTWKNKLGIEDRVTEYRYILKSLWPENSGSIHDEDDDTCPFQVGGLYKYNGRHSFLCLRVPGYGKDGLLVRDLNDYVKINTNTQSGTEKATVNYPHSNVLLDISNELNASAISSNIFWQKLSACANNDCTISVRSLKTRRYWSCCNDNSETIRVVCLGNGSDFWEEPGYWAWDPTTKEWTMWAYRIFYKDGKCMVEHITGGAWLSAAEDKGAKEPGSNWVRNTELETKSQSVPLQ